MCLGMLLLDLVWGGLAVLPRDPPKPPNIAQVGVVLCCQAEPHSLSILLFLGWEQHSDAC
jgi:hypothetical protein